MEDWKVYFIYGYLYKCAEDSKNQGLFPDLTIKEVIEVFMLGGMKND